MTIENGVGLANENAGAVYHGRTLRRLMDKLCMGGDVRTLGGSATTGIANGGIARSGEYAVVQRGAGANMSVDVAAGGALVGGTESATQGEYFVFNDATVNVVISASDPSNPRIDVVGIQVRDKEYSGSNDDARLVVITGTPAGSPSVPALPADFLSLAHVAVAAGATSIVNANITDKRVRLSALGGIAVCTSATRPTVNLWEGMFIYETDTHALKQYTTGTTLWTAPWNLPWGILVATTATSSSSALTAAQTADVLSMTVSTVANRRLQYVISWNLLGGDNATVGRTSIVDGSGTQKSTSAYDHTVPNASFAMGLTDIFYENPAALSSATRKMRLLNAAGASTVQFFAEASPRVAVAQLFDVGNTGAPA